MFVKPTLFVFGGGLIYGAYWWEPTPMIVCLLEQLWSMVLWNDSHNDNLKIKQWKQNRIINKIIVKNIYIIKPS